MRPCIFVIGTRTKLVKVAPVLRLAAASGLSHTVWLAGQHRDSIDDLFLDFYLRSEIEASQFREERSSVGMQWAPLALRECHRYIRTFRCREKKDH